MFLSLLVLDECEIELGELRAVADYVDLADLFIREGEAQDAEEVSARSDHQADVSVDENRACGSGALGGFDGMVGPELRTANFGGKRGRGGSCVGADDEIGVEH